MADSDIEKTVALHYSMGSVKERILTALDLHNATPGSVPVDRLFPVDQLHHGGLGLTKRMAEFSNISSGIRVLDAGSGIGGSARFLVDRYDCNVEAIELSTEFIRTAEHLDHLVGLDSRINHRVGSVTNLPYDAEAFDLVWCQNVAMNVQNKKAMFAEVFRVLRPSGRFVLSYVGANNDATVDYPLPWAMSEETSFTALPAEFLNALKEAGFANVTDHDEGIAPSPPPAMPDGQPDDSLAMGDDMPKRRANAGRAVASGSLVPMLVTALKKDV